MPAHFLRVPHIQQRSNADCLAACAAMLLEYVGLRVDYVRLVRVLGISELGTPYSRIRRLPSIDPNLSLRYEVGEIEEIIHYLDAGYPVGIFVEASELPYWSEPSGHAVVVVGYSDKNFLLNDPALSDAPQIVSYEDLHLAWQEYDFYLAVVQRKQKPR